MPLTAAPSLSITPADLGNSDDLLGRVKMALSIGFDAHDERLRDCIRAARDQVGRYTGLLLYPCAVVLRFAELYDYERLPGPISGAVSLTDLQGLTLTGVALPTVEEPVLRGDFPRGVALSYDAGYELDKVPFSLQEAIVQCAANNFDDGARMWTSKAAPYRVTTWAS